MVIVGHSKVVANQSDAAPARGHAVVQSDQSMCGDQLVLVSLLVSCIGRGHEMLGQCCG